MIRTLAVHDFVLLQELNLELGPGLNVLTGGSGEGKSLALQALRFALGAGNGGRATAARLIRPGAEELRVELQLELGPAQAAEWGAEEGPLTLSRSLHRSGKGRCLANGRPLPLARLRELGGRVLESFAQGAAASLVEEERQRAILDGYGGLASAAADFASRRSEALELARELDRLLAAQEQLHAEWELRRSEHDTLGALNPQPDEYSALRDEVERLEGQLSQLSRLDRLERRLREGDDALLDTLHELSGELSQLSERWPRLSEAMESLACAAAQLDEAANCVLSERESTELDGEELATKRERQSAFQQAARRLRVLPEALAQRWSELQAEGDPAALAARCCACERKAKRARLALERAAQALSQARAAASAALCAATLTQLPALGLGEARFSVELTTLGSAAKGARGAAALESRYPSPHGDEQVRFLFSANAALEPGPLNEASGGELARLFLALGIQVAEREQRGVLLFDEVDQNVGARLGAAVAACLATIATKRQVLCVTHLATVAARADRHLALRKSGDRCTARALDDPARVDELALMIKGAPITPAARAQAEELLLEARPAKPRRKRARRGRGREQAA